MTKEERKLYNKKYYEKNKELILSKQKISGKEYYEKNKERIKERNKQWKEQNKESISAKGREYYEKNKEQIKENSKKWREQNKERNSEIIKQWRHKNREHVNALQREWNKNNSERVREISINNYRNHKESFKARHERWLEQNKDYYKEYNKLYTPYYNITHKKRTNIMKEHWTETLDGIDDQIAKLKQLKQSIIEKTNLTDEEQTEQTEPTVDRYGFRKYEKRVYYDLPEYQEVKDYRNMNHVPLEGASNYELYENGELFSRKEGRFIDGHTSDNSGEIVWKVVGDDGNLIFIRRKLEMKKCFPDFKEKIKSRHGLQYS